MNYKQFKTDFAGRELKVEVGKFAQQANGSALITYGETSILATCVVDKDLRKVDYLPLSVEYEEKLYAAGKIKSGRFMKREGRATDEATLTGRMIDRTIRPCFNQRIRNDIQIVLTILSFDKENDADIPALIAASLSIGLSGIPWNGPVGAVRVGRSLLSEDGAKQKWVLNPTYKAREESDFDLVMAGKDNRINMLEGGAKEVPEDIILSGMEFAQSQIEKIVDFQKEIIKEINPEELALDIEEIDPELIKKAQEFLKDKLEGVVYQPESAEYSKNIFLLEKELIEHLSEDSEKTENQLRDIFENETDKLVHKNILEAEDGKEKRPDGRKLDQVRTIKCDTSSLPRVHGSGLFQRGWTQALSVITLGSLREGQMIDNMEVDLTKNFMHHYNFPPFCTGETGRFGGPGRREIGHGALAEKALLPLIPDIEKFPYTIRLVSEILSSNGSSSMASVSGSSLSLMDAGVPIKRHVTGVAMGLILESEDSYKILTDIQGPEDHYGDMDCKVAGTEKGMTACQMDVKIEGIPLEVLKKVFKQAKEGRLFILEEMNKTIGSPRSELSSSAPCVLTVKINPDKIGSVIGAGGKIINGIIKETGANIDIEDDGSVNIISDDAKKSQRALEIVESLTHEVEAGEIFQGKVVKITDFGAFVEVLPGQDGLLHISELSEQRVDRVEDVIKLDQIITVKVKDASNGRISLTLKNNK